MENKKGGFLSNAASLRTNPNAVANQNKPKQAT